MPGAGCQLASPACHAATTTSPAPVKDSPVPASVAGPWTNPNDTGNPLDAVAANSTAPVAIWLPSAGKSTAWSAFETTSTPLVSPA